MGAFYGLLGFTVNVAKCHSHHPTRRDRRFDANSRGGNYKMP